MFKLFSGKVSTGKSQVSRHLQLLMPRKGERFQFKEEEGKKCTLLKENMTRRRHVIFLDPPNLKESCNLICNWVYQGSVERTHNQKLEDFNVWSGIFFIWKNEERNLSQLDITSKTKAILMFQHWIDDREHQIGCEKRIADLDKVASSVYPMFLKRPDFDELVQEIEDLTAKYQNEAKKSNQVQVINEIDRICRHYALVHAGTVQFLRLNKLKNLGLDAHETLMEYIVRTAIPEVQKLIVSQNVEDLPEEHDEKKLEALLASVIEKMNWKQIAHSFYFSHKTKTPKIGISLQMWDLPIMCRNSFRDTALAMTEQLFKSKRRSRQFFLKLDSPTDWWTNPSDTTKGVTIRTMAYTFDQEELPVSIFKAMVASISKTVPTVANTKTSTLIGPLIRDHFFPCQKNTKMMLQCMEGPI